MMIDMEDQEVIKNLAVKISQVAAGFEERQVISSIGILISSILQDYETIERHLFWNNFITMVTENSHKINGREL